MNAQLMNESLRLLQAECSPKAGIEMNIIDQTDLLVMSSLLNSYDFVYTRKIHLLTLYAVLSLATKRHQDCSYTDPNLTRKILDGDYLYSLYIQLALQFDEYDLISYMAPRIKKWQIKGAEGHSNEASLFTYLEQFLNLEFQHHQASKAIEQVG
ncbi:hypothetical protein [Paenibacillus sp. IHBB 10380]|uniref:hypothetical protein n=1 Tax=Paenibacillus sp. IHBB 10380 TaxID=1566358 RepID=UPI0005CFBF3E|nr:hypothetical protein [Paenibacillus sp. IHBB 10380]AJS61051.1 hypothetical protein UB51_24345 [Paenibacillus sp. IHBB 10380]